jgi:3-isopropylmalate/(R)-2-methylmalate dehydratase large subunit
LRKVTERANLTARRLDGGLVPEGQALLIQIAGELYCSPCNPGRRSLKLTGRVLHLLEDALLVRKQLDGEAVDPTAKAYAYGVNTDAMISGRACTLGYTPEVLGPHFLENFLDTVAQEDVKGGGFQVVVGGDAYGSGSSREQAVVAHRGAGVELVVADSFQRIFQENMVYGGMPFTADREIVSRLEAGEDVDLDALREELPPFFRAVAAEGGLLAYGRKLLAGEVGPSYSVERNETPLNIVEKLIARQVWRGGEAFGVASVSPGDQVLCQAAFRGVHEYTAGMVMSLYRDAFGDAALSRPELVAAFEDHFVLIDHATVPEHVKRSRLEPARRLTQEMVALCEQNSIRLHGPGRAYPPGVCHRIVVEDYALPGDIIVLTDSHTPTAGVLNAFAFGVGSTAMAFAWRTGLIPVTVPKVIRVDVHGDAKGVLSPKDLILHLIGDPYFREEHWRTSPTDTCVIEFGGPALEQWSVDELSVLTNMTVEGGLMTGVVAPCEPLATFLKQRRDVDARPLFVDADPGASYARVIRVDLDEVPLTIATPGDSRNRAPLSEHGHVAIHNVVIASCTGGSLADLRAAAEVFRGRELADGVRLTITPSSADVARDARAEGLLDEFARVGGVISEPGCGSCIGNGPGVPLPDETTASTTNRNFARRMGAPGPVYLVSPAVAAASAVRGTLTDPRDL